MANASDSLEIEPPAKEKSGHAINDNDTLKLLSDEITSILQLDDTEKKEQILGDLLSNGRQSLPKYQEDLIPKVYKLAMDGNDCELTKSLKKYFAHQWKVQYGSSNEWFILFYNQYQDDDQYRCVLNRAAEYGNKYMGDCPILSIVLQVLFEDIDDKCLNETSIFNDLWLTITTYGLKSVTKYSEYIAKKKLDKLINKEQVVLFQALREYYRPELFRLLRESNIKDRGNLYELALDNVAEHGWLTGLQAIEDDVAPRSFNILLEKVRWKNQEQQSAPVDVKDDGATLTKDQLPPSTIPKPIDIPAKQEETIPEPPLADTMLPTTEMEQVPAEDHMRQAEKAVDNDDSRTEPKCQPEPETDDGIDGSILQSSPESIREILNDIQKKFSLQHRDINRIKHELAELEELKRTCDGLNPAVVHLRKQNYPDINALNRKIEDLNAEKKTKLEADEIEKDKIESRLESLELSLRKYWSLSSQAVDSDARRKMQGDYLKELGYSNIAAVIEAVTKAKNSREESLRVIEKNNKELSNSLSGLESIRADYNSLLERSECISSAVTDCLQNKGFSSPASLDQKIQEKKSIVGKLKKNKQAYDFGDGLDASAVNVDFERISQCEKVNDANLKKIAVDTKEILKNYMREYGNFLDREIKGAYNAIISTGCEENFSQYSDDLTKRLSELSLLSDYRRAFECIDGAKKVESWKDVFCSYRHTLSDEMKKYQEDHKKKELRIRLHIANALSCVDRFCSPKLVEGFEILYKKYLVTADEQWEKDYTTLTEDISNGDYQKAAMVLSNNCACFSYVRYSAQIKHHLETSLSELMHATTSKTKWLGENIETKNYQKELGEIKENNEKLSKALEENSFRSLLGDTIRNHMEQFRDDMDRILSDIILQRLDAIEGLLDTDCFVEAEQSMEKLVRVQYELQDIYRYNSVREKVEKLKKRLEKIESEILKRDFQDVNKYPVNSPKAFLEKLKSAKEKFPAKYAKAYETMSNKIHQHFDDAIKQTDSASGSERYAKLSSLEDALWYTPNDWEINFKSQMKKRWESINIEESTSRDELMKSLQNTDTNDNAIIRLATLAQQFHEQKMDELLKKLCQEVLQKLEDYQEKVEHCLNESEMKSALSIVQKIMKFNEMLSSYVPQVTKIYKDVCNLAVLGFCKCCDILMNIATFAETDIVDKALDNMVAFIKFWVTLDAARKEFPSEKILGAIQVALLKIYEFFNENSRKYKAAIPGIQITELETIIKVSRQWDAFLRKLKKFCENSNSKSVETFSEALAKLTLYEDMCAELAKNIDDLTSQLNVELISESTVLFAEKRDAFFRNLMQLISKLRAIHSALKDFSPSTFDMRKLEAQIKRKIQILGEQLLKYSAKEDLTFEEFDRFRINYEHLLSLANHIDREEIDIKTSFLDKSEETILERVESLRKQIENSISNVEEVAKMLCRMKVFAENLSMFDTQINAQLNEALIVHKEKGGSAALDRLVARLQKTDVGARIISEHPLLKGLDWRLRRERMQNQDNLDYILRLLEGDAVDKYSLEAYYETFRKKYHDAVSNNLGSLDQQDQNQVNLETLVKSIKNFVGAAAHKSDTLNWTQCFRGKITDLLAHIFAIWTLQNTEYYNAARGIESRQAYLLMPYVAQVIAIFRILGIGYKNPETSKTFVNNLVEIRTGEGKSVVMAVTACVFALIGMDVNCSCYSEVLSVRDQESFASLFKALNVAERIEYGTFNKLCENLLNEQCDVREKVRDMILENKDKLPVGVTTETVRRKILLIDEVDVFLSDKFYGGMYIPSVYLKHSAIKTLLDTIWKDRTIRGLKDIRSKPAYVACATQFSNWTSLLDEAVKDMIATLKSFQPSTYIVQNDRIVYVENESIAENVVRGYDTIWAYYYECERGRISQNSLDYNVGIIVNCGTFSYAEMPHDFAYITGVTGTLKTLADSEKRILETVYSVHRNTFMPTVFTNCRRNYNCKTDVHAVNETEYFMEIRGEIDTICNAQRAILVFFECEEKLMAFYNSAELSSLKKDVQIITERVSVKDRDLHIRRAVTIGKVTLLTRTYGRGTDFMCHNQQLLANGGIHVLQTFFTEEVSEEYQIMGRGARQGDRGSYSMILLDKSLEWVLGPAWEKRLPDIVGTKLYETLNTARNALYESQCNAKQLSIEQCKKEHKASRSFMNALSVGQMENVKKFLMEQNRGANSVSGSSRTLLLMDATSSMSALLSAAKETVCTMFERASSTLKEKGLRSDAFQMQFAVYRDYDCKEEGVLQSSSWETNPVKLRSFMDNIRARGGGDYEEAIEVGLWHAVQQSEEPGGISQIVLIGDAPAKNSTAIARDRRATGGDSYWGATKFRNPTHYTNEMRRLKEKDIPVHAFYLHDGAKVNFEQIARETEGTCKSLDITSPQGAELLTHFVTQEVLRKAAGDEGDAVVALYAAKYVKKTFIS